jgi:hypothetical protein
MADRDQYIRQLGLPTDPRQVQVLRDITEALKAGDVKRVIELHADYYDDSTSYWSREFQQRGAQEIVDPDETVKVRPKEGRDTVFVTWSVEKLSKGGPRRGRLSQFERMEHDDAAQLILERHW